MDALERESHRLRGSGAVERDAAERWRDALLDTARRLEVAWLTLEEAAQEEWHRWSALVASVREWHRPRWVLWTITVLVVGVLVYVGLVVGGYVDGPAVLDAFADWWWTWWDRVVEPA